MIVKNKGKIKNVILVIVYILVLAILVGGAFAIISNLTKAPMTVNGKDVAKGETLSLLDEATLYFDISEKEYTVKILANSEGPRFSYIIGGDKEVDHLSIDYTSCFDIKRSSEGFSLSAPLSFEEIFITLFDEKDVVYPDELDFSEYAYFIIEISFNDETYKFPLKANFGNIASSLVLDKEIVIF